MRNLLLLMLLVTSTIVCTAVTLTVGSGGTYQTPTQAAQDAAPGDTILMLPGDYTGTFMISDVHGTADAWITIAGVHPATVVFNGGTESLHLSRCSYLQVENVSVTGQTGNGMNIDDGGILDVPTHHVRVKNVSFRQMAASGNNDMLKLSGLDDFEIVNCSFGNGAAGGSGIDMVGCHHGVIRQCSFSNMGSNAIQAKGGTQYLRIERNFFVDCGNRTLNLGGSTGLAYFRPPDAAFEAADIQVYANIFEGSQAPIAYVGSLRIDVSNNLFRNPGKWILRILQETTQPEGRFEECANSFFRNNIVLYPAGTMPTVNIGPNTRPESFTISHNLFFGAANDTRSPLSGYPFADVASIVGVDPMLAFNCPPANSVVVGAGVVVAGLTVDFNGRPFGVPPSIGACEVSDAVHVADFKSANTSIPCVTIVYNGRTEATVEVAEYCTPVTVAGVSILGQIVAYYTLSPGLHNLTHNVGWQFLIPLNQK